ncbi:hypothetical protein ABQE57_01050 [Mycolicibacterium elephantis]|uniref:hypothetical protein n=1 Tax=Mycolicibacterium elephantis TaxID=81858 RepID=UPI0007E96933|nr:hypothetical protein [Mycolicibacterium elephantis]OBB16326.1 hypothetical protein A5762_03475 [Mycolicibacterium elephantis]OBE95270.1 hypothetical protein A5776_01915 [Mycolicibacterium elephantis]
MTREPGESDWDDEDLLTITEATQRLADEIEACRARIRRAEQTPTASAASVDVVELDAERRRLRELMAAANRITSAQANSPR